MNNITVFNDLIYAGTKLVCARIGAPQKEHNGYSKPGWDIRRETQIRKLR